MDSFSSSRKGKKELWSPEEDAKLVNHITSHGHGNWTTVPTLAGLQRCGKSCRLRWKNYLRPGLKRGPFSEQEERVIIDVHRILGNKWSQIAMHLPAGRTDNEVKNFWNSRIKKKLIAQGLDPNTHNLLSVSSKSNHNNPSKTENNSSQQKFTIQMTTTATSSTRQQLIAGAETIRDQDPVSGLIATSSENHYDIFDFRHTSSGESTPSMFSTSSSVSMLNDACMNWSSGIELPFEQQCKQLQRHEMPEPEEICDDQIMMTPVNVDYHYLESAGNTFDEASNYFDYAFMDQTTMALQPQVYNYGMNSCNDQLAWN